MKNEFCWKLEINLLKIRINFQNWFMEVNSKTEKVRTKAKVDCQVCEKWWDLCAMSYGKGFGSFLNKWLFYLFFTSINQWDFTSLIVCLFQKSSINEFPVYKKKIISFCNRHEDWFPSHNDKRKSSAVIESIHKM